MRQLRSWAMELMIEPVSSTPFSPGIRQSTPEEQGKDPAAVARGLAAGLKGGQGARGKAQPCRTARHEPAHCMVDEDQVPEP